jgi:hypothetical protein
MNQIYVVFDVQITNDIMAFETEAMAKSFMAHPANSQRILDLQAVPFRGLPIDLDVPDFI